MHLLKHKIFFYITGMLIISSSVCLFGAVAAVTTATQLITSTGAPLVGPTLPEYTVLTEIDVENGVGGCEYTNPLAFPTGHTSIYLQAPGSDGVALSGDLTFAKDAVVNFFNSSALTVSGTWSYPSGGPTLHLGNQTGNITISHSNAFASTEMPVKITSDLEHATAKLLSLPQLIRAHFVLLGGRIRINDTLEVSGTIQGPGSMDLAGAMKLEATFPTTTKSTDPCSDFSGKIRCYADITMGPVPRYGTLELKGANPTITFTQPGILGNLIVPEETTINLNITGLLMIENFTAAGSVTLNFGSSGAGSCVCPKATSTKLAAKLTIKNFPATNDSFSVRGGTTATVLVIPPHTPKELVTRGKDFVGSIVYGN